MLTSSVDRRFYALALKLESSERRYRRLFERSLAGVYFSTLEGRILDCNDACSRNLGYTSRQEQLAHTERDIYLGSVDGETFLSKLKEQRALTNFEHRLQRRDNSTRWVLENATRLEGDNGGALVAEGTLIDITERKQSEIELRHINSLLEARQREIEEELSLAARVQQTLAPGSLTWEGVSVEAFYEPVRRIGGDFGVVAPRADCLSILVCDVCGYGISSALVANWIYFETVSQIEDSVELGTMLHHLNRFVLRNLASSGFFFTLAAARLSHRRRTLEFAGAGHPPAMMVRRGREPRLLESRSAVLGLLENAVVPEAQNSFPSRCGGRLNR